MNRTSLERSAPPAGGGSASGGSARALRSAHGRGSRSGTAAPVADARLPFASLLGPPSRRGPGELTGHGAGVDPLREAAEQGRRLRELPVAPLAPPPLSSPRPVEAAAPAAPVLAPEALQGLVEYAALTRDLQGQHELRLGLGRDLLGGLRVGLVGRGGRRLGLRVRSGEGSAVDGAWVEQIVAALRAAGLEVVDVDGP